MKRNPAQGNRTILIVEDDRQVLDLLIRVLSSKGYTAMKAERGSEALHIVDGIRPDLVILDLKLPDCNGIEVLDRLKAIDETIQVVILTGYGSQEAARSAMENGAFDFLTKPFEIHELCSVIREALICEPPLARKENHYA